MFETRHKALMQKLLRWGGFALFILCLVYLVRALAKLDLPQITANMGLQDWSLMFAAGAAYGGGLALLASGWGAMASPSRKLSLVSVIAIYGPAVVAKYLPGSIFQYASRQLLGARRGVEQRAMVRASIYEAAFHIPAALLAGGLLLSDGWQWWLGATILISVGLASLSRRPAFFAAAMQILFFCFYALLVLALASFAIPATDPVRLSACFMIAWTAGFLVPVAPGGIGVREAALLAIAVPGESLETVAYLALLTRLAGVSGDGLMGLWGYWAGLRLSARENRQALG